MIPAYFVALWLSFGGVTLGFSKDMAAHANQSLHAVQRHHQPWLCLK
jgi:hypothetical protein